MKAGTSPRLLLATNNLHKQREMSAIISTMDLDLELVMPAQLFLPPLPPEGSDDYAANSAAKARAWAAASGLPTLGDDSGLEVDALDGAPGIHSARYGGEKTAFAEKIEKLLAALEKVPTEKRGARFVCVAALALPGGGVVTSRGVCEGRIHNRPLGEGGFGYDPIFWLEQPGMTMAQLPAEVKNRISHRARALAGLRDSLAALSGSIAGPGGA